MGSPAVLSNKDRDSLRCEYQLRSYQVETVRHRSSSVLVSVRVAVNNISFIMKWQYKEEHPFEKREPRARRSGGSILTESPSSWRRVPRPGLVIWTRRSASYPAISLWASSTSSSGRGSV